MNIQALLGTRPAAGPPRRPGSIEKSRDKEQAGGASGEPQDVVEISVEGKERAAADSGEGQG